ncbi:GNAT family N-acetyltransferase [Haloechinothrix halophila]|uniref:GNAT family N-acetyltransferase n=1 Tax=Haloechinothrix halophila TaxID=1069073 RepID=UPI000404595A|nr:GNAT family N-acetyltransferase [Haloechinothrix halophila]
MEPIEINAGTHYLRQFRADDRMDDRPALLAALADPGIQRAFPDRDVRTSEHASDYIDARAAGWRDDDHYTWVIAELTTGTLLGEIRLEFREGAAAGIETGGDADRVAADDGEPTTAHLTVWTHPDARRGGAASTAVGTVLRFGFGALDLVHVDAACAEDNVAAVALAKRCGFTSDGTADAPGVLRWTARG